VLSTLGTVARRGRRPAGVGQVRIRVSNELLADMLRLPGKIEAVYGDPMHSSVTMFLVETDLVAETKVPEMLGFFSEVTPMKAKVEWKVWNEELREWVVPNKQGGKQSEGVDGQ
jgi:hypothetical protein